MQNETTENTVTKTQSIINRSAVKKYALKISKEKRAGKFTRVSEEFLTQVEADLDSSIRKLADGGVYADFNSLAPTDGAWFITGQTIKKAEERLNMLATVIIHRKVMRHPTIGCTLK
jgi:hypothetical protein